MSSTPLDFRNSCISLTYCSRSSSLPVTFGLMSVYFSRSAASSLSMAAIVSARLRIACAFSVITIPAVPTICSRRFFFSSSLASSTPMADAFLRWSEMSALTATRASCGAMTFVFALSPTSAASILESSSRSLALRSWIDAPHALRSFARYAAYSSISVSA